jgi:hypothetical protein
MSMSLGDGVALVRRVLAEATTQPRWPMYPRQFKQFLKSAQPDFDERRYGSINDLMRACQKDGLLRLERDRQGGLRVFANGANARASVPHGWAVGRENGHDSEIVAPEAASATEPVADIAAVVEEVPPPVIEAQVTAVREEEVAAAPAAKAKRASRARKTPTGEKKKAAPRRKKQA